MYEEAAGGSRLMAAAELVGRLDDPALRIVDARFELTQPSAGLELYRRGHVPGAVHLDLDRDLAAPPARGRGRHPLPDMDAFARRLGELGIDDRTAVVVYDQDGSMYAARAWWLLRYAGHDAVKFLDGGFAGYLAAGGPVSTEPARPQPTRFALRLRQSMVMWGDELRARLGEPGLVPLDARAPERYRGESEPFDEQAGHIPTALNRPFNVSIAPGGLLSPAELARRHGLDELSKAETLVAYCGSGVSAAHLVLALEEAGLSGVRLYPGSWSEWASREGFPVATGPEPGDAHG